jgi:hypothetical protein
MNVKMVTWRFSLGKGELLKAVLSEISGEKPNENNENNVKAQPSTQGGEQGCDVPTEPKPSGDFAQAGRNSLDGYTIGPLPGSSPTIPTSFTLEELDEAVRRVVQMCPRPRPLARS